MKIKRKQLEHIYEVLDKENISYLQETISEWYPDLFKPKFELGTWYIEDNDMPNLFRFCGTFDGVGDPNGYGFLWNMEEPYLPLEESDISGWGGDFVEANDKQVKKAMLKEAKRLGFKEGVKFYGVQGSEKNELLTINEIEFNMHGLYSGDSYIFYNGKWAEPYKEIKKMTIEQVSNELGYKIEIIKLF